MLFSTSIVSAGLTASVGTDILLVTPYSDPFIWSSVQRRRRDPVRSGLVWESTAARGSSLTPGSHPQPPVSPGVHAAPWTKLLLLPVCSLGLVRPPSPLRALLEIILLGPLWTLMWPHPVEVVPSSQSRPQSMICTAGKLIGFPFSLHQPRYLCPRQGPHCFCTGPLL